MTDAILHTVAAGLFSAVVALMGGMLKRAIAHLDTSVQNLSKSSAERDVKIAEISVRLAFVETQILALQQGTRPRRKK